VNACSSLKEQPKQERPASWAKQKKTRNNLKKEGKNSRRQPKNNYALQSSNLKQNKNSFIN